MRQPLVRRSNPGMARVTPISLPAPFGGINASDSLAGGMQPFEAIDLVNWSPVEGAVETRPGYRIAVDLGTAAPVPFLHAFDEGQTATIAASGGKLFKITGDVPAALQLGSGFNSDVWRPAVLGGRLHLVNGTDAPRSVLGSALVTPAWTGPADITKLFRVRAHANRLFFAERGSSSFWYGNLASIQGALTSFDLSGVGSRGGSIEDIAVITPDGGRSGDDDAIVFFMSSGEAIMYRGSNPGDAAAWARVGVFTATRPIASETFGGDVLTVSADGYAELSRLLPSGRSPVAGFGTKIGRLAASAIARFGRNPGWQLLYDPRSRLVLIHIPQTSRFAEQHVMSVATGAWGRWRDLPASSWGHIGDDLAFGTMDGKIARMTGASDLGRPIVAVGQGSWQTMGLAGRRKRVTSVRPIVTSQVSPFVTPLLGVDFKEPRRGVAIQSAESADIGRWDQSVWDRAVWGGADRVTTELQGVGGVGDFLSVGLRADTRAGAVRWLSTTLTIEAGGLA
ncbi:MULTISPECIES: hypothetical protein [unclassified Aureimonas]|uniref:hypothetical protein n=1 Tax=unclassified Aureimonas TaxID=2615206 RepID=UPI0006FF4D58|nr:MULTISPECIES: hypothetical protein [unclassified Aureimonas]KQT52268.1 hypothetical protein ASG62_16565 [Aureimonas sp. Leaf427]KQT73242.1 hypothetical protein ASG54_17840 [Aureimonas sp. Leaf460]